MQCFFLNGLRSLQQTNQLMFVSSMTLPVCWIHIWAQLFKAGLSKSWVNVNVKTRINKHISKRLLPFSFDLDFSLPLA